MSSFERVGRVQPSLLRAVSVVTLAEDDVAAMADAASSSDWAGSVSAQEDMLALRASLRRQLQHVEALVRGSVAA